MAEPSSGQVITPGGSTPEPPKDPQPTEVAVNLSQYPNASPQPPVQQPAIAPQPAVINQPSPQLQAAPPEFSQITQQPSLPPAPSQPPQEPVPPVEPEAPVSGFAPQFQVDEQQLESQQNSADSLSWTASEYIAHQKSSGWYAVLAIATAAFAVLVYLLTSGDILSVIVIVLAAIVFGIYAGKRPKEQQYAVSPAGISIGSKTYGFDQLRTFAFVDEGAFSSIVFLPMKRFMPALSIYYDPKDEENIVDTLSNYLPMDTQKRDMVDNLMRKIRF